MKMHAPIKAVKLVLDYGHELSLVMNEKNLLFTGAKIAYLGGGWWEITGYAQDKKDIAAAVIVLDMTKKAIAVEQGIT